MPFPHAYVTPLKPSPMLALLVLLLTACPLQAHEPHEASKPTASAKDSPTRTSYDPVRYEAQLTALEQRRLRLARRYARATTERDRAIVRQRARRVVTEAILDTIFPAWMGTPWGLGANSTATRPHQEGMVVGCSYFVTSVLQNAGLKLSSRRAFAQAPALHIQRSLAPERDDLHRIFSIPPSTLAARLGKLDDGLYLIGLTNHVGFVVVRGNVVRFVHAGAPAEQDEASYVVGDEPLAEAESIAYSQRSGYFVTPLFHDDRLITFWLEGTAVPFQKLGI